MNPTNNKSGSSIPWSSELTTNALIEQQAAHSAEPASESQSSLEANQHLCSLHELGWISSTLPWWYWITSSAHTHVDPIA